MLVLAPAEARAQSPADAEKSILLVGTLSEGFIEVPFDDGTKEWVQAQAVGLCTGWFASESGHIVTAGHCVDPAEGRLAMLANLLNEVGQPELLPEADANWVVEGLS